MTRQPITNKRRMYSLLSGGALGNTTRQHFSVADWLASPDHARFEVWGVRTLTPGGPCRQHCPRDDVQVVAEAYQSAGHAVNISVMIDAVCAVTLFADVYDSPTGLEVYGVEHPGKGASWRVVMPRHGRTWRGLSARMLLARHLNAASLADVYELLEAYPSHVVELSACDRNMGVIPGRNYVCWECRNY